MQKGASSINLFGYLDYREFLRDWYVAAKKRRSLSLRSFAKKARLKSFNFFNLVMDGHRNLTEESLAKVGAGVGLNKQEMEFFRNLVLYTQAKTSEEKNRHYATLVRSRKFSETKPIERDQYEYYAAWYHPVVREVIASKDWDGTAEWIAEKIQPPLTTAQAERSISLLERLGFIEKTADGRWRQANTLISTGAELQSHVVHQYHKLILDLTKEVLDKVPPARRDVSTMTLGVARSRVDEIKKMIRQFRQDLLKLVADDTQPEDVIQLNIQMFPLTVPSGPPLPQEVV